MDFSKNVKIGITVADKLSSKEGIHIHHSIREISESMIESEHAHGKALPVFAPSILVSRLKALSVGYYRMKEPLRSTMPILLKLIEGNFFLKECVSGDQTFSSKHSWILPQDFKTTQETNENMLINTKISNFFTPVFTNQFIKTKHVH